MPHKPQKSYYYSPRALQISYDRPYITIRRDKKNNNNKIKGIKLVVKIVSRNVCGSGVPVCSCGGVLKHLKAEGLGFFFFFLIT